MGLKFVSILFLLVAAIYGMYSLLTQHACRKRGGGGAGGLQSASPNSLLKFVDFVNEKGCESQDHRNENSNSYIFDHAIPESIQSAISFESYDSKFQNFPG